MNLIVQILLGCILEVFHRWWRVSLIYLSGVLAGSLGNFVFDPTHKLAGASGGVYSLITAHVATIILVNRQRTFYTYGPTLQSPRPVELERDASSPIQPHCLLGVHSGRSAARFLFVRPARRPHRPFVRRLGRTAGRRADPEEYILE